jgi:hypothetical protein
MATSFRKIFGAKDVHGVQHAIDVGSDLGLSDDTHIINMAKDFSATPSGRSEDDGQHNGARLREEFLVPALENDGIAILHLDGVAPCAASFVEEAFAPLVTKHHFSPDYLREHLRLFVDKDHLHDDTVDLAFHYIDNAAVD